MVRSTSCTTTALAISIPATLARCISHRSVRVRPSSKWCGPRRLAPWRPDSWSAPNVEDVVAELTDALPGLDHVAQRRLFQRSVDGAVQRLPNQLPAVPVAKGTRLREFFPQLHHGRP